MRGQLSGMQYHLCRYNDRACQMIGAAPLWNSWGAAGGLLGYVAYVWVLWLSYIHL
jgi:hypothetical protein